jgi:hypothetical protein
MEGNIFVKNKKIINYVYETFPKNEIIFETTNIFGKFNYLVCAAILFSKSKFSKIILEENIDTQFFNSEGEKLIKFVAEYYETFIYLIFGRYNEKLEFILEYTTNKSFEMLELCQNNPKCYFLLFQKIIECNKTIPYFSKFKKIKKLKQRLNDMKKNINNNHVTKKINKIIKKLI